MANYNSKYKGSEIEALLDKQNAMPSPTAQDEGKVLGVNASGEYELLQPEIEEGSITESKIVNGAVSEQKLAQAVRDKINNTVNLTGNQTIEGYKVFSDGIETETIFGDTLSIVSDDDGEINVHGKLRIDTQDGIIVESNGGVWVNVDDQLNVEASDTYFNTNVAVDGNFNVVGSIHATSKVYTNDKELATKEYVDTGLATKQDAMAPLTTAEINSICV